VDIKKNKVSIYLLLISWPNVYSVTCFLSLVGVWSGTVDCDLQIEWSRSPALYMLRVLCKLFGFLTVIQNQCAESYGCLIY